MTILSVGYPLFPVSADASGGAEQILAYLDRQLILRGNRSLVVAAEGSRISGKLFPTMGPMSSISDEDRRKAQAEHQSTIEQCLRRENVDLVHFHSLDFHTYVPRTQVPMLATLHLPIEWYPSCIFELPGVQLNCVSHTQAGGRNLPVVPNGIDVDFFRPQGAKEDYLLWLGRICPEKGVHVALRVAQRYDLRLIVAGPVHPLPAHQDYFRREVAPLLDDRRTHLGPVGGEEKRRLLSAAKCLLVPSTVAETSSLVSMEAISSGTPVIALRSGALPEVIDHGVTGFVVDDEDDFADAISRLQSISPERCRAIALQRFDARRMAEDYFALQASLIARVAAPV